MRGPAVIVAVLALLAAAAPAGAQPAIVRPADERGMSSLELGRELFAGNCARCHGSRGDGTPGRGPSLRGSGRLAADFYLRTGYMPLGDPHEQPQRRPVQFRENEVRALEDYVDSLGGGPDVPAPDPERGSLSEGLQLFTEHCAGCHQVVGEGGVVTGARVPPLRRATATQIAEAVRLGPYVMPRFSPRQISDAQLDSIVAYVQYAKEPDDPGGWGIGHIGPVPEGMVAWLVAAVALVGMCIVIGERLRS